MNLNEQVLPGTIFKGIPTTNQAQLERLMKLKDQGLVPSNGAIVLNVYGGKYTCDVITPNGMQKNNVPVSTKAGLFGSNKNVYGTFDMPAVNDVVILDFIGGQESRPYICGIIVPYLVSQFQDQQTPPNSANKQFTKKLFENGKEDWYRIITKSGTTIEVQGATGGDAVGTVIIETPSGTYFELKESTGDIIFVPKNDFIVQLASGKTVQLGGSTDAATLYTELNTQLQNLITALNSHTHAVTSAPGTSGPPLAPMSLDISSAQSAKVKVGG